MPPEFLQLEPVRIETEISMKYLNYSGFVQMGASLAGEVAIYGTGKRARNVVQKFLLNNRNITELYAVTDREGAKPLYLADGTAVQVRTLSYLSKVHESVTVLLLEEERLMEDIRLLQALHLPDSVRYCIAIREFMSAASCGVGAQVPPPEMPGHAIPKRLHSFWFSGEEKPELYRRCIGSWHEVMPDYEIIEWDRHTYDVDACPFTRSAAEQGAWAFVSDYARLDVIHRFGGIYLDMDVRVLRRFDDLLRCGTFLAYDAEGNIDLGSGFGAEAGSLLIGDLMRCYDGRTYTNHADYNQPAYLRDAFLRHGIHMNGDFQVLGDTVIYPRNRFTPYDSIAHICYADLSGTYSMHLYNSGWLGAGKMSRRDSRYAAYDAVIELIGREEFERASRKAIADREFMNLA